MSLILAKDDGTTLSKHVGDMVSKFNDLLKSKSIKCLISEELKKCIEYAIYLHDLGKVLPYFQIRYVKNKDYQPFEVSVNIYHSLFSILLISQDILKDKVGENNVKFILSAVAYHHWKEAITRLISFGSDVFINCRDKFTDEYLDNMENNLKEELKRISEVVNLISFNKDMLTGLANGIPFSDYIIPPYQLYWMPQRIELNKEEKKKWILISGFLQRCDHFASFCEEQENNYDIEIQNIDSENINKNIEKKIKDKILKDTKNKLNFNLWQSNKLNGIDKENIVLIAPTGCGKTEFAFLWSGGDKFFYTLPSKAAVEQIYERAKLVFGDERTTLLHSDADIYLLGDNNDLESLGTYEVSRQLSYPAIIATGDQFFPYGLRPPGYERIYATFAYSRLIIDEVQAYDPKSAAIIVKFIEDVNRIGGKFLLMTATIPEYIKKEIENRNGCVVPIEINLYEENKQSYSNFIKHKIDFNLIDNDSINKNKNFNIQDDIIDKIVSSAEHDKRVLVILNTVKQAKDVYERISKKTKNTKIKNDNILLFHSQFTQNEKNEKSKQIESLFKNPKPDDEIEGKIIISTQSVEASLDLDADILFTEIAPMDVLVQRMGRVLRRYKENFILPDENEPNVHLLIFKNGYESGNGYVYDKELIEKTLIIFDNFNDRATINDMVKEYYKNNLFIFNRLKMFGINQSNGNKKKNSSDKVLDKESINKKFIITLSEYDKYNLVRILYENIDKEGNYLSDFYKTLDILDAGFMSDRKEEAHIMFREIINVSVIESEKEENFKIAINEFLNNEHINYTIFKKKIIGEFVIQIPYYEFENLKKGTTNAWIEKCSISDIRLKKKIKRWTDNIYIINSRATNQDNNFENSDEKERDNII